MSILIAIGIPLGAIALNVLAWTFGAESRTGFDESSPLSQPQRSNGSSDAEGPPGGLLLSSPARA